MGERAFFQEDAKTQATKAIEAVEAQTSAEVVIALRRRSGDYSQADHASGAIMALAALMALLFLPQPFPLITFPLDVALAYGIGMLIARAVPPVKRLLTTRRTRSKNVDLHALATFVELGISRTQQRNGILLYLSMFERQARVVPDIGIEPSMLGEPWQDVVTGIERAVARMDYDAFLDAVRALGPVLGPAMPRAEDDINELPDQVQ